MRAINVFLVSMVTASAALAKLPAPNEEALAKAAEAAAKTAHAGKVDAYLLCKTQDKVSAHYYKTAKGLGKETKPAVTTPPCADPGAFSYAPAGPAAGPTAPEAVAAAKDKKKP
jgi:hypothetical protein